jgi:hypothetical protein
MMSSASDLDFCVGMPNDEPTTVYLKDGTPIAMEAVRLAKALLQRGLVFMVRPDLTLDFFARVRGASLSDDDKDLIDTYRSDLVALGLAAQQKARVN